jgi:hypothetical protein
MNYSRSLSRRDDRVQFDRQVDVQVVEASWEKRPAKLVFDAVGQPVVLEAVLPP